MLEMSGNSGVAEVSDEDLLLRLSLLMIDELLLRLRIAFKRSAIAHSLRRPPLASMSHSMFALEALQLVMDVAVACKLNGMCSCAPVPVFLSPRHREFRRWLHVHWGDNEVCGASMHPLIMSSTC